MMLLACLPRLKNIWARETSEIDIRNNYFHGYSILRIAGKELDSLGIYAKNIC